MKSDSDDTRFFGFAMLAVTAIFAVYWPAIQGDFLWDDDTHYTTNNVLQSGGLLSTWLGIGQPNYWPLTWTSFWVEHQLFGFNPTASHVINLWLHVLNVLLVERIARKLGLPFAWGIAFLFALHPANVESVAWITQRKNLLSMCFALASSLMFVTHLEKPRRSTDLLGLALYACSLLSKGAAIGLPLVFVAIAWWKRVSLDKSFLSRLAPHVGFAALFALVEVGFMTSVRAKEAIFDLSLPERVELVLRNASFYLQKSVFPTDLTFVYPRWNLGTVAIDAFIPLVVWAAALAAVLVRKPQGWRGIAASQAVVIVMLLPVLGVFDIYFFKYAFVADHYLYLALPAVVCLIVSALAQLPDRVAIAAIGSLCVIFAGMSWGQSHIYQNNEALWTDTARKNPDAWMAHNNLGVIAQGEGRYADARTLYEAALKHQPGELDLAGLHLNLGNVSFFLEDFEEAKRHFAKAVSFNLGLTQAWCNLATSYAKLGDDALQVATLRNALKFADDEARVHYVLAQALNERGKTEEAEVHMERAREILATRSK